MALFSNNILLLYPAHSLLLLLFFLCPPYTPFFFRLPFFSISQFYFYNPPGSPAVSTTRFFSLNLQNIILRILIITATLYNLLYSESNQGRVFECADNTHAYVQPSNVEWTATESTRYKWKLQDKNLKLAKSGSLMQGFYMNDNWKQVSTNQHV